jgi:amidohydrolase
MPDASPRPAHASVAAKEAARVAVDDRIGDLIGLSHAIHGDPELSFDEVRSSALAADALARGGFRVTTGTAGLPTAFVAEAGDGPLVLAICAEYDALPDVGHACGHNIIAATAVGAGLGLLPLADELGVTVRVLGTPAEEGGGGKVLMLDAGVFDDVHAAMMVHPWATERLEATCLAVHHFDVAFTGRTAHASPPRGRASTPVTPWSWPRSPSGSSASSSRPATSSTVSSPTAARRPTSSRPG